MTPSPKAHSFKFSTRYLFLVIAAAAFISWMVRNYYDLQKLAQSRAELRAARSELVTARTAANSLLFNNLLDDPNLIGKKADDYFWLDKLCINPDQLDGGQLAVEAIQDGKVTRLSADSQPESVTYVRGDLALKFSLNDGELPNSKSFGYYVYIRNGKIVAILTYSHPGPS